MPNIVKPVIAAARDAVQNIPESCDGYHAQLITAFVGAIQSVELNATETEQRKEIREIVVRLANTVSAKMEE